MDRRKFLTKTPVAGAGLITILGTSDTRLYGQPKSSVETNEVEKVVPHMLRLHYSMGGLDPNRANAYPALSGLAKAILKDQTVAARFAEDPKGYLQQMGFETSSFDVNSTEFKMVQALASPAVRTAAANKDHVAFFNAMSTVSASSNSALSPVSDLRPPVLPPGGGVGGEPCCANTNVSVNVTVNINVAGTATVVAVAIAFVVVSVVAALAIAVAGESPDAAGLGTGGSMAVANALAGPSFSQDVMRTEVRSRVAELIDGINAGSVRLPEGVSAQDAIASLNQTVAKHFV